MYQKTTQRAIRDAIKKGIAIDITGYDFDSGNRLRHAHDLEIIALSTGVYGMNGAILMDEARQLYGITKRTSILFQMV